MNRQQLTAVCAAFAVMAGLVPMAVAAEKLPVDFYEISCRTDPGTQWVSRNGKRMHIRGGVSQSIFYDATTFEELGQDTIVVNFTMKMKNGNIKVCGTFSLLYLPLSNTATFDGTWRGSMTAATGMTARAVGKGTFSLEGSKMKLDMWSVAPEQVPPELLTILGESPWTECEDLAGVSRATGFVRVKSDE